MRAGWRLLVALALMGATVPGLAARPPQAPSFSSRIDAVRVDVLVTEGPQVVRGLSGPGSVAQGIEIGARSSMIFGSAE